MRQLTASLEDVVHLDDLLTQVSFDASREEWRALLAAEGEDDRESGGSGGGTASSSASPASKVRLGATGVFNADGDLIGLASTVVYDGRFGWCGNIVVRADYRKRGVASMVLRAALDAMNRSASGSEGEERRKNKIVSAFLDASDMGLPLYLKAGFTPMSRVRRYFLSRDNAASRATMAAAAATAARKEREGGREGEETGCGHEHASPPPPLEAIDWDGAAGAAVTAMDAAVFGAERGFLLSAWRDTCPELAVWIPNVAYSVAHVRGRHVYLGPCGMNPAAVAATEGGGGGGEVGAVDEKIIGGFFEGVLALATRTLADGRRDVDGIVVYVPEALETGSDAEEGEARGFKAASVVRRVLEEAGFEAQEVTTRMAAAAGECASGEDDIDDIDAAASSAEEVPGDASSCLTVASLDLG